MSTENPAVRRNEFGQPIGPALPDWTPRNRPERVTLSGQYCSVEPLDVERHGASLFEAFRVKGAESMWTYLWVGPFEALADYQEYARTISRTEDPLHFAVVDTQTGRALGTFSLMRIEPTHGVIEIGHVTFSPLLQRTRVSTEAQSLLMGYVFDTLGYRRLEWKCDSFNEPSRSAAKRLGYEYEGRFRQAIVTRGRSRDTDWFSIIDGDWPVLRAGFKAWLNPSNFDEQNEQRQSLSACRDAARSRALGA